ncbi:alpha/beta hydrolase [Rhodoferax saidenbachensis]|uniref:Alpha/beta hydrolase n=1 Tax=Rhodoferax saidenbachensis TaxID=1484693 RepID=A0A1P8KFI6_9BURK|nr:alpha/beta hydrolase [Rhodoferax saidenbachensis]
MTLAATVPLLLPSSVLAQSVSPVPGVVVMHGKGGSPQRHVNELAAALASQGYKVANLEMPWSGQREYDAPLDAAEKQVDEAIASLRSQGAAKVFVAGHSQGGLFALYYASRHTVDGAIALAPGGDPGSATPREKLADAVQKAHTLVAEGKGNDKVQLADYEGSKGTTPLHTTPAIYLTWFDPNSALGMLASIQRMPATTPVLYVAPRNDYPALVRINPSLFAALPRHPLTQYYEPSVSHLRAPTASIPEVLEWTRAVSAAR